MEHLVKSCSKGQFLGVTKAFYRLTPEEKLDPAVCYVTGFAYIRLHRPDIARGLLLHALVNGFEGYSRWESTGDLLSRCSQMEKFQPPFVRNFHEGKEVRVKVFAGETPWMSPVIAAMPQYMARAKQVFGPDYPFMTFYFFQTRDRFETFYTAMFGRKTREWWHDGTGNYNVVLYCELDRFGKASRLAGAKATIADVMHEYGHALCTTYYGDGYLKAVPNWVNEGFADIIAYPFFAERYGDSQKALVELSAEGPPPSYRQMCRDLYKDPKLGYPLARLMVQDLLAQKTGRIKRILDVARTTGSFERALKETTGFDGRHWYDGAVSRYWARARVLRGRDTLHASPAGTERPD